MGGTPGACMAFGMALEALSLPCTLFIRHLAGRAGITHNVLAFPASCHSSENLQWGVLKVPFKRGLPSFLNVSEPSLPEPEFFHITNSSQSKLVYLPVMAALQAALRTIKVSQQKILRVDPQVIKKQLVPVFGRSHRRASVV